MVAVLPRLHASAFRLELRQVYTMPGEADELRRFRAGEPPPAVPLRAGSTPWRTPSGRQDHAPGAGRRAPADRLHRYEFAWGFAYNVGAGEDIRILDLTDQPAPGLPEHDFWLFDDSTVVKLLYRPDGTQIGRELLEAPTSTRTSAGGRHLGAAVPFRDYCQDTPVSVFEPEELGQRKDELALALRDARTAAGLTGERLAARCGISQSKISKLETGKVLATVTDVERILTALGHQPGPHAELLALARLANTEFQSVRASLRGACTSKQRELAALEADAAHIRFFLPLMITGLLQTPEYARASLANFPGDHPQAIAKRLDRQAALYNRPSASPSSSPKPRSAGSCASRRHGRPDGTPCVAVGAAEHPPGHHPAGRPRPGRPAQHLHASTTSASPPPRPSAGSS